jgi:hypothetical protein
MAPIRGMTAAHMNSMKARTLAELAPWRVHTRYTVLIGPSHSG